VYLKVVDLTLTVHTMKLTQEYTKKTLMLVDSLHKISVLQLLKDRCLVAGASSVCSRRSSNVGLEPSSAHCSVRSGKSNQLAVPTSAPSHQEESLVLADWSGWTSTAPSGDEAIECHDGNVPMASAPANASGRPGSPMDEVDSSTFVLTSMNSRFEDFTTAADRGGVNLTKAAQEAGDDDLLREACSEVAETALVPLNSMLWQGQSQLVTVEEADEFMEGQNQEEDQEASNDVGENFVEENRMGSVRMS